MCEHKREKGQWRKLHNRELCNLYSSLNIIRTIKSRRMRWTQHVACIGKMSSKYRNLEGRDHLEDIGADGRIINMYHK